MYAHRVCVWPSAVPCDHYHCWSLLHNFVKHRPQGYPNQLPEFTTQSVSLVRVCGAEPSRGHIEHSAAAVFGDLGSEWESVSTYQWVALSCSTRITATGEVSEKLRLSVVENWFCWCSAEGANSLGAFKWWHKFSSVKECDRCSLSSPPIATYTDWLYGQRYTFNTTYVTRRPGSLVPGPICLNLLTLFPTACPAYQHTLLVKVVFYAQSKSVSQHSPPYRRDEDEVVLGRVSCYASAIDLLRVATIHGSCTAVGKRRDDMRPRVSV